MPPPLWAVWAMAAAWAAAIVGGLGNPMGAIVGGCLGWLVETIRRRSFGAAVGGHGDHRDGPALVPAA